MRGRRVGLQLYGEEPNRPLVDALLAAGATVHTVAPYVYAPASDGARVAALVDALAGGRVDAIAFTSASQVDRLWQVGARGRPEGEARLHRGSRGARGRDRPIVVEALAARGVRIDIVPEKSFVMRRLVNAIAEALGRRRARVTPSMRPAGVAVAVAAVGACSGLTSGCAGARGRNGASARARAVEQRAASAIPTASPTASPPSRGTPR